MLGLAAHLHAVGDTPGADLHQPDLTAGRVRQYQQGAGIGRATRAGAKNKRGQGNHDGGVSRRAAHHHRLSLSAAAP
jgi:hypothetical protein